MGIPSLSTILLIWGILAPLGTYGWTKADAFFQKRAAVASAVRMAQADARQQCNVRVESIKTEIENDAAKQIEQARQAAAAVVLAPADDAGVRILCNRSASCRERQAR